MTKFYSYILPIAFFVFIFYLFVKISFSYSLYGFIAIQLFVYGVPLIWIDRVAERFNHKKISILTIIGGIMLLSWIIFIIWVDHNLGL